MSLTQKIAILAVIVPAIGVAWNIFGSPKKSHKDKFQTLHQEVSDSENVSSQVIESDGKDNTVLVQGPGSTINIHPEKQQNQEDHEPKVDRPSSVVPSGARLRPVEQSSVTSPGYTKSEPGNILLTGEVNDISPSLTEAEHNEDPNRGWLGHATIQKHVPASHPLLKSAYLFVTRYEEMPPFVPAGSCAGMAKAIDVSFHLMRKANKPPTVDTPWKFPATHYRDYDPEDSPINPFIPAREFTGIVLEDSDPRDVRVYISAAESGIYWITGYLLVSDGAHEGTVENLNLFRKPIVLAFYNPVDSATEVKLLNKAEKSGEWVPTGVRNKSIPQ